MHFNATIHVRSDDDDHPRVKRFNKSAWLEFGDLAIFADDNPAWLRGLAAAATELAGHLESSEVAS